MAAAEVRFFPEEQCVQSLVSLRFSKTHNPFLFRYAGNQFGIKAIRRGLPLKGQELKKPNALFLEKLKVAPYLLCVHFGM